MKEGQKFYVPMFQNCRQRPRHRLRPRRISGADARCRRRGAGHRAKRGIGGALPQPGSGSGGGRSVPIPGGPAGSGVRRHLLRAGGGASAARPSARDDPPGGRKAAARRRCWSSRRRTRNAWRSSPRTSIWTRRTSVRFRIRCWRFTWKRMAWVGLRCTSGRRPWNRCPRWHPCRRSSASSSSAGWTTASSAGNWSRDVGPILCAEVCWSCIALALWSRLAVATFSATQPSPLPRLGRTPSGN